MSLAGLFPERDVCFEFLCLSSFPATSHPEWCGSWSASVWLVDSAVRWRRNGAGGLKENHCSFAVVCSRFFRRLFFAIRRIARAAVSRHGGSPLRLSPGSPPQAAFALFRKSARCLVRKLCFMVNAGDVLVPKPAGRVLRASAGRGFGSPG